MIFPSNEFAEKKNFRVKFKMTHSLNCDSLALKFMHAKRELIN